MSHHRFSLASVVIIGGVFLLSMTGCARVSTYEQTFGSPAKAVAERYFPQSVHMVWTMDGRDEAAVTATMAHLHRYFPQVVTKDMTLRALLLQGLDGIEAIPLHGEETLSLQDELLPAFTLQTRVSLGFEFLKPLDEAKQLEDALIYGGVIVRDIFALEEINRKILGLENVIEETYNGITYTAIRTEEGEFFAFLEKDLLLFSTTKEGIRRMIDLREKDAEHLLRLSIFEDVAEEVASPMLTSAFVNGTALYPILGTYGEELMITPPASMEEIEEYYWMGLSLNEKMLSHVLLMHTADEWYAGKGIDLKEMLFTSPSLGQYVTPGKVLIMSEGNKQASMLLALVKDFVDQEVAAQLGIVRNIVQNNTGISWSDSMLPFADLPMTMAVVDTGMVVPTFEVLVDTSSRDDLGNIMVEKGVEGVQRLVGFMVNIGIEELRPVQEQLVLEAIPNGNVLRLPLASFVTTEEVLAVPAGALLAQSTIEWAITKENGVTRLRLGVQGETETEEDGEFQKFVQREAQGTRLGISYVGIGALASYAERLTEGEALEADVERVFAIMKQLPRLEFVAHLRPSSAMVLRTTLPIELR